MKLKILISLILLAIVQFSCKNKNRKNILTSQPVKFETEWRLIQLSKNKEEESIAVNRFIERLYNEKRTDSTGIKFGLHYSYEDLKGRSRNISELFEDNAADSLKTIIIEITPSIENQILERQKYEDWKPKDLRNLRYFMDK